MNDYVQLIIDFMQVALALDRDVLRTCHTEMSTGISSRKCTRRKMQCLLSALPLSIIIGHHIYTVVTAIKFWPQAFFPKSLSWATSNLFQRVWIYTLSMHSNCSSLYDQQLLVLLMVPVDRFKCMPDHKFTMWVPPPPPQWMLWRLCLWTGWFVHSSLYLKLHKTPWVCCSFPMELHVHEHWLVQQHASKYITLSCFHSSALALHFCLHGHVTGTWMLPHALAEDGKPQSHHTDNRCLHTVRMHSGMCSSGLGTQASVHVQGKLPVIELGLLTSRHTHHRFCNLHEPLRASFTLAPGSHAGCTSTAKKLRSPNTPLQEREDLISSLSEVGHERTQCISSKRVLADWSNLEWTTSLCFSGPPECVCMFVASTNEFTNWLLAWHH